MLVKDHQATEIESFDLTFVDGSGHTRMLVEFFKSVQITKRSMDIGAASFGASLSPTRIRQQHVYVEE